MDLWEQLLKVHQLFVVEWERIAIILDAINTTKIPILGHK
jgi:hypothetical protein